MGRRIPAIQQYDLTPKDVIRRRKSALENLANVAPSVTAEEMPVEENLIEEPLIEEPLPEEEASLPEPSEEPMQEDDAEPVEALQTEVPTMPEPGTTATIKKETDEFEPMFKKYQEDLGKIQSEQEAEDQAMQEAESRAQTATGIAGALQAFGEGLAAITGGSAKPLQTGAEALRRSTQQGLEAQMRRGKGIKQRIEMAREPLETKATELKFRDVFEKRQAQQRLNDPESKESADARGMASNFLDVYVANLQNRAVDPEAIQRVEGVRSKIGQMNANQIQKFLDNLKDIKFSTSYETTVEGKKELEETKAASKVEAATTKREQKLQDEASKWRQTTGTKITEIVNDERKYKTRINDFSTLLERALAAKTDTEFKTIANEIARQKTVIDYLDARQVEPKGVFTDQDAARLSSITNGRPWLQQFQDWLSKGLQGTTTIDEIKTLNRIIKEKQKDINNPIRSKVVTDMLKVGANDPYNKYKKEQADSLASDLLTDEETVESKPEVTPSKKYESIDDVKRDRSNIKSGDKIEVKDSSGKYSQYEAYSEGNSVKLRKISP
jgi:hypothetical protein